MHLNTECLNKNTLSTFYFQYTFFKLKIFKNEHFARRVVSRVESLRLLYRILLVGGYV